MSYHTHKIIGNCANCGEPLSINKAHSHKCIGAVNSGMTVYGSENSKIKRFDTTIIIDKDKHIQELQERISTLEKENEKFREALEFYTKYYTTDDDEYYFIKVRDCDWEKQEDGSMVAGKLARQVLSQASPTTSQTKEGV